MAWSTGGLSLSFFFSWDVCVPKTSPTLGITLTSGTTPTLGTFKISKSSKFSELQKILLPRIHQGYYRLLQACSRLNCQYILCANWYYVNSTHIVLFLYLLFQSNIKRLENYQAWWRGGYPLWWVFQKCKFLWEMATPSFTYLLKFLGKKYLNEA